MLVALALLLAGCADPDPDEELADAVDRTLADSVAYSLTLEGDAGAAVGAEAGSLLGGLLIEGVRGDGSWSVGMSVLGFDVFELRSAGEDRRHFRLGLGEVLALMGGGEVDPGEPIAEDLRARGVDEDVVEIVAAGFRGGWLTVEGPIDAADLDRALGAEVSEDAPDRGALAEVLGGDIRGFVERYVSVTEVRDVGNDRVFDVEVDAQELAREVGALAPGDPDGSDDTDEPDDPAAPGEPDDADLGALPDRLPGTVSVRDGLVREIVLDVADPGEDAAGLEVKLELSQHGAATGVETPDETTTVPADRFLEALRELSLLFQEIDAPVPAP